MNLIITFDSSAYFFPVINNEENIVCEVLKSNSRICRLVRRTPFYKYAFNKNIKRYAEAAKKIIIFDSAYTNELGKYLYKYKDKVIIYIWNPVSKTSQGQGEKWVEDAKRYAHLYSFDPSDCNKYDIDFCPMLYSKKMHLEKEKNLFSVFFLGAGKKREETIETLLHTLFLNVSNCKFIVVNGENQYEDIEYSSHRFTYKEYLSYVAKSTAILDIPQDGQCGNTIRVVESLFFKKKLITTNKMIESYDFYNSNNIFIVGKDDPKNLEAFLKSPYETVNSNILNNYDIEDRIKRM